MEIVRLGCWWFCLGMFEDVLNKVLLDIIWVVFNWRGYCVIFKCIGIICFLKRIFEKSIDGSVIECVKCRVVMVEVGFFVVVLYWYVFV